MVLWVGVFVISQRRPLPALLGSIDEGLNLVSLLSSQKGQNYIHYQKNMHSCILRTIKTKHACVLTYFT